MARMSAHQMRNFAHETHNDVAGVFDADLRRQRRVQVRRAALRRLFVRRQTHSVAHPHDFERHCFSVLFKILLCCVAAIAAIATSLARSCLARLATTNNQQPHKLNQNE